MNAIPFCMQSPMKLKTGGYCRSTSVILVQADSSRFSGGYCTSTRSILVDSTRADSPRFFRQRVSVAGLVNGTHIGVRPRNILEKDLVVAGTIVAARQYMGY
jgi:hypothetical protein